MGSLSKKSVLDEYWNLILQIEQFVKNPTDTDQEITRLHVDKMKKFIKLLMNLEALK